MAGGSATTLDVAGTLDNSDGRIASNAAALALNAGVVVNADGKLLHAGTQGLTVSADSVQDRKGEIATAGALQLTVGSIDHRQARLQATQLKIDAQSLDNSGGTVIASGELANVINATMLSNDGGTLASAGALQLLAFSLDNRGGTVRAAGNSALTVSVDGVLDNSSKGLLAGGGAVTLKAGSVDNRDGSLSVGDALDAQVDGTLNNRGGTMAANQDVTLGVGALLNGEGGTLASVKHDLRIDSRGGIDNNGGAMQAAGQLHLQAASLANRAGTLAAADGRLDTRQGTLDNSHGVIASTVGGLDILSGALLNDTGLIQASKALSIDTLGQQLLNTNAGTRGGILSGGSAQLRTGALDNQAGLVHAQGALDVRLSSLDNRSTGQFGSSAGLELHAQRLDNRSGTVQAGQDAWLRLDNELLNQGGLVVASGTLDASAGSIDNRDTQGGSAVRGLQGNSVLLAAGQVDNRNGTVATNQQLRIDSTGDLLNAGGLVSSAGTVQVNVATLGNRGGTLLSGGNQNLDVARLDGAGRVLSQGELVLNIQQGHVNDGRITVNGKASITSGGTWTNIGSVQAGELTLHARDIDNTASGKISGISTHVIADATLTNRGVIDGVKTRIDTATVDNVGSGRIYGDQLSIQAGTLINREETVDGTTRAATLAARERLDLGVGRLVNREHALIFSAGGSDQALNIGGALDANGYAIGRAGSVHNASATIESLGGLAINTSSLLNGNEHFATTEVLVEGPKKILYIQPKGDANKYDSGSFVWSSWSRAGKYRWKDDPPPNETGVLGQSPVPRVGEQSCVDGAGGEEVCTRAPGADYLPNNPAWAYFGVPAPEAAPVKPQLTDPGIDGDATKLEAALKDWQARHEQWEAQTDARYVALDEKIGTYNDTFGGRDIKDWTQFDVTRTVYETQVTRSDPGKILSGGRMQLNGDSLVNDKSQILAGGALTGDLGNLRNVDAFGEQRVHEEGTSQYTYSRWRGGFKRYHERKWDDKIAYRPADEVRTINLDITRTLGNTRGNGSGYQVGGRDTGNVGGQVGGAAGVGTGGSQRQVTEVSAAVDSLTRPGSSQGSTANGSPQHLPTTVRTVAANTELPTSSLFRAGPNAGRYLVETDPQFADYRSWLGSDYLLQKMGYDPAATQKRLGDGFYEQKLVREQIAQLTGRRFLDGYANDEAQYRALLDNAATLAEAWGLRPGVALTAAQMAQLTSDVVWLVEQTVTLPDGSTRTALVPQVYVRVRPGDLDGRGTLLAGQTLNLDLRGDLVNSGTLAGRTAVQINAENIRNLDGRITGDAVNLRARTDLDNLGGLIDARSVLAASAGRDMNMLTTTRSGSNTAGQSDFSRTNIDRVAGLFVSDGAGTLLASAGRDINLNGAQVVNAGTGGQTAMVAGRDLNLGTVTESRQENNARNADNYLRGGYSRGVGSEVRAVGDIQLQAGGDVNMRAARIDSNQGSLAVVAAGDVNIGVSEDSSNWSEGRKYQHNSLLGKTTRTSRDSLEEVRAQGSSLGADTIVVKGRNVRVTGSDVLSDSSTALVAVEDLTIEAARNTSVETHFKKKEQSGLIHNGGFAVTAGNQMQSEDFRSTRDRSSASTVGSLSGDVALIAGGSYRQEGSHVLAPKGDVDIHARDVKITEVRESENTTQESKFRQSGLTVALSAPVINALHTASSMANATSKTPDWRKQAMGLVTAAGAVKEGVDAVRSDPAAAGGLSISITVGAAKSDSRTTTRSDTSAGSTVKAGGDVRISATGAGHDSDITIQGSDVSADGSIKLQADGDIALLASRDVVEMERKSSSVSGGVGVAVTVGSGGASAGITANASASRGKGDGNDVYWNNSHVTAGKALMIESGGNTTLRGAVAKADQVAMNVGGTLAIESLQDTHSYHSKDQTIGGGMTVGAGFSGSASVSRQKTDSDARTVVEQSGIRAGDGGFQLKVGDRTDLTGTVIESSNEAIASGRNRLETAALTVRDIENTSQAKASAGGIGVSDESFSGLYGAAKTMLGNKLVHGNAAGGSEGSTRTAISQGAVVITDEQLQSALTGKTADSRIASLNRDTANAHQAATRVDLDRLEERVLAEHAITAEAFRQGTAWTTDLVHKAATTDSRIILQVCDAGGTNCRQTEVSIGQVEAVDGKLRIFNNGIFNAEPYALATGAKQNTDEANAAGVYYILNPYTGNPVAEGLYAAYDKLNGILGSLTGVTLPVTAASNTNVELLKRSQENGWEYDSVNHSRGSMTYYNALLTLRGRERKVFPIGYVLFNGAAANAQQTANLVDRLTNGEGAVWQNTHPTDIVGRWHVILGGNPATSEKNGGSFPKSHSAYVGYLPADGTDLRALTDKVWGVGKINQPVRVLPKSKKGSEK